MTELADKHGSGAHREMKLAAFEAVMGAVRAGARTRREIQAHAALSWGATSQCVSRLQEIGMLVAGQPERVSGGEGRRPVSVGVPEKRFLVTALEMYPLEAVGVTMNLAGEVVWTHRLEFDDAGDNAALEKRLEVWRGELERRFRPGAVREWHLVLTGAVDAVRRVWLRTPQLPHMRDFSVANPELTLFFEHDVTARAREVVRQLSLPENSGYVFFHIGRGVGMAVCEEGRFLHGARGMAGEIGHLPLGGTHLCSCGNSGCLESLFYPANLFTEAGIARDPGPLAAYAAGLNAEETDALARTLCGHLLRLLVTAVNLFDPPCMIAGGEILAPVRTRVLELWPEFCRRHGWAAPEVPLLFYETEAGAAAAGSARAGVELLTQRLLRELV